MPKGIRNHYMRYERNKRGKEVFIEGSHLSILTGNGFDFQFIFRVWNSEIVRAAFGWGNFSSFSGNFFKENENLENMFGSFSFQKFSKKMKIFCFLTSM